MRDSMTVLVAHVRDLVGDAAGAGEVFSDDELERFLDQRRTDVRNMQMTFPEHVVSGGTIEYPEAFADIGGAWEDSVELRDQNYAVVAPDTSDLLVGRWTFSPARDSSNAYMTLNGQLYDVHAAAADALDAWAVKEARAFDVQTQGAKFARSQKIKGLKEAALLMRARQRPVIGRLVRTDECS